MKKLYFYSLFFICLLFNACEKSDIKIAEVSESESKRIKAIGDTISQKLLGALKNELTTAIQENGVENAIQKCNIKALPLTNEIASASNYYVDIKRTTDKYRNPKNKPNFIETKVLNHYLELQSNKEELPVYYIQKIADGNIEYFNYYKPLKTGSMCLLCHGEPESMNQSVKKIINRLYPNDLAKGYNEGDFRGLLRISIKSNK